MIEVRVLVEYAHGVRARTRDPPRRLRRPLRCRGDREHGRIDPSTPSAADRGPARRGAPAAPHPARDRRLGVAALLAGAYGITRSPLLDLDRGRGHRRHRAPDRTRSLDRDRARARGSAARSRSRRRRGRRHRSPVGSETADRPALVAGNAWTVDVTRRVPVALLPTGDGAGVVIDAEGDRGRVAPRARRRPICRSSPSPPIGELGDVQDVRPPGHSCRRGRARPTSLPGSRPSASTTGEAEDRRARPRSRWRAPSPSSATRHRHRRQARRPPHGVGSCRPDVHGA